LQKSIKGFASAGQLFTKKWNFLSFWWPWAPIDVKFCRAKQTQVSLGYAKFHVNRCNESPLWGKNVDFRPVSKFNTGSLLLRGNPTSNNQIKLWGKKLHLFFNIFVKSCFILIIFGKQIPE